MTFSSLNDIIKSTHAIDAKGGRLPIGIPGRLQIGMHGRLRRYPHFDYLTDFSRTRAPCTLADRSATACEYGQSFEYTRRSALGPVARRRDLSSDGIEADQLKRVFVWLALTSVHFNEDAAAIRH